ncbi:FAD-dependent monooxygenase [Planctomonas sp. JC2975]|uniref:FAD-dependent oxidoreductase n=1 Tax=Planctomonas sp. JC2975 TaxID=2729626 RepID=UPI00147335F7|nr:FAD-dependent monooxygenase [Planctomonas sp. JC2975]NNC12668.1 FAD-dependent monooxygenase [Planctomonas sp. JC2975]
MSSVRSALIVGAGVAGPAAALALAKVGIRSTIVESHPGPADGVGAVITLASNGYDVLRTLGVASSVDAEAQRTFEVHMSDAGGQTFARYPSSGFVMARDALSGILADHAARAGSRVEYGRRLVGAEAASDGVVAHFEDGAELATDLVVGADGIHSTVRGIIDPDAPDPVYEGVLGFGGITDAGATSADPGVMNFAFGRRFLGYWRLPDGRICWYAALPRAEETSWRQIEGTPSSSWLARLRAEYAGLYPAEDLLALSTPDDLVTTGPMLRMPPVPHWHGARRRFRSCAVLHLWTRGIAGAGECARARQVSSGPA